MKKLIVLLSFFSLLTAGTCVDEPLEGDFGSETQMACDEAIQNVDIAETNFLTVTPADPEYTELCTIYRQTLLNQIEICGDPVGSLQTIVNGLGDCTGNPDNYFYVEIDGQEFLHSSFNGVNLQPAQDLLLIGATDGTTIITINMPIDIVPGSYTFPEIASEMDWQYEQTPGASTQPVTDTVNLTITMHDTANNRIEGTFDWDCFLETDPNLTFTINNGSFLITYQ